MPITSDDINNQESTRSTNSEDQMRDNYKKGLYYNSSYEIENFIKVQKMNSEVLDPYEALNDPTLTGFKLFFHFADTSGLLANQSNVNSASAYLNRIGENQREYLLDRFIKSLSDVNIICPWLFQDITGLREMYERDRSQVLHTESKIEIKTLETIDGKIGSLMKMYRDISYDENRQVWVLPENLRKFSMSVYVYDYRMFSNKTSDSEHSTAKDFLQTLSNTDIKNLNHTLFELSDCSFDMASGGSFFENVSNNLADYVGNNLTISSQKCYISALFRTITGRGQLGASNLEIAKVGSSRLGVNNFGEKSEWGLTNMDARIDRLKDTQLYRGVMDRKDELKNLLDAQYLKKTGLNILQEGEQRLQDRIEAELSQLYFGNVHGFGIDDVLRMNQDNTYKSAFVNTYSTVNGNQSLNNSNPYKDDLGNINN